MQSILLCHDVRHDPIHSSPFRRINVAIYHQSLKMYCLLNMLHAKIIINRGQERPCKTLNPVHFLMMKRHRFKSIFNCNTKYIYSTIHSIFFQFTGVNESETSFHFQHFNPCTTRTYSKMDQLMLINDYEQETL